MYEPILTDISFTTLGTSDAHMVDRWWSKCRLCKGGFEIGDEVMFIRTSRGDTVLHCRYEHKRCWEKQRNDYLANRA